MHDVTEGGVLGPYGKCAGFRVRGGNYKSSIPVLPETAKICGYFNINPLKLISSGCMLISANSGRSLVEKLSGEGYRHQSSVK